MASGDRMCRVESSWRHPRRETRPEWRYRAGRWRDGSTVEVDRFSLGPDDLAPLLRPSDSHHTAFEPGRSVRPAERAPSHVRTRSVSLLKAPPKIFFYQKTNYPPNILGEGSVTFFYFFYHVYAWLVVGSSKSSWVGERGGVTFGTLLFSNRFRETTTFEHFEDHRWVGYRVPTTHSPIRKIFRGHGPAHPVPVIIPEKNGPSIFLGIKL